MVLALPKGAVFVLFVLSFGVCCRLMDSLCPSACAVCMSDRPPNENRPHCVVCLQVIVRHTMQQQLLPTLINTEDFNTLTLTCTGDKGHFACSV